MCIGRMNQSSLFGQWEGPEEREQVPVVEGPIVVSVEPVDPNLDHSALPTNFVSKYCFGTIESAAVLYTPDPAAIQTTLTDNVLSVHFNRPTFFVAFNVKYEYKEEPNTPFRVKPILVAKNSTDEDLKKVDATMLWVQAFVANLNNEMNNRTTKSLPEERVTFALDSAVRLDVDAEKMAELVNGDDGVDELMVDRMFEQCSPATNGNIHMFFIWDDVLGLDKMFTIGERVYILSPRYTLAPANPLEIAQYMLKQEHYVDHDVVPPLPDNMGLWLEPDTGMCFSHFLASVTHELLHGFGLPHSAVGLMYPTALSYGHWAMGLQHPDDSYGGCVFLCSFASKLVLLSKFIQQTNSDYLLWQSEDDYYTFQHATENITMLVSCPADASPARNAFISAKQIAFKFDESIRSLIVVFENSFVSVTEKELQAKSLDPRFIRSADVSVFDNQLNEVSAASENSETAVRVPVVQLQTLQLTMPPVITVSYLTNDIEDDEWGTPADENEEDEF